MLYPNAWPVAVIALAVVALRAPAAPADKQPVQPTKEWSGSVEDEALLSEAPGLLTSAHGLKKLWKDWQIAGQLPEVDFSKEVVVIVTTQGSKLRLAPSLDEKGNLQVVGLATRDLRPGFRYVMATIRRQGVKTVNGKDLPKE